MLLPSPRGILEHQLTFSSLELTSREILKVGELTVQCDQNGCNKCAEQSSEKETDRIFMHKIIPLLCNLRKAKVENNWFLNYKGNCNVIQLAHLSNHNSKYNFYSCSFRMTFKLKVMC